MTAPTQRTIPARSPEIIRRRRQRLYNGVYLLGDGPCEANVNRIDMGAVPYLTACMRHGIRLDPDHFKKMEVELVRDMERTTEDVKQMTGYYVNLDSGDQVADLLFKKIGLKQARPKLTKSGDRESVEDEVLKAIQHLHPVVRKIQDFKEYSKLKGTYVIPIPKLARRVGLGHWRLFPNLGHTRVPSGRLNAKDPNLLAIPNRTARGREIRKGFIPAPGFKIVSVDESQIEVRVAAHCSKDPNLIGIYHNKEDVYSDFATAAFKLSDERFINDKGKWEYPTVDARIHRFPAKTCVLASIYDVTAGGLLEQMPVVCKNCNKPPTCAKCQQGEPNHTCYVHDCHRFESLWNENNCQDMLNSFYMRYGGILRDRLNNHKIVRRHTLLWDMWGRVLHVQAVRSVLEWVVAAALREAGNFPYQSGAQGTIKLVMAQVMDEFAEWKMLGDICNPLLQIHDELLLEVREDMTQDVGQHIAYRFENCVQLEVPIKAGVAVADTWGDLEK